MRIGYYIADQNPHRDRSLGISTYTRALIGQVVARSNITVCSLESCSSLVAPQAVQRRILPFRTDHPLGRLLADQSHPVLSRPKVDLWHYPKGFLPLFCQYPEPAVGTVCDVILQHYADNYPNSRHTLAFGYWLQMLKRSIERLDLILTISEFSRRQIAEFAARHRLRCPPVIVTFLGVDWNSAVQRSKEDFVLHLAAIEPHKRTSTVLDFWSRIESSRRLPVRLELVGTLNDTDYARAKQMKTVRIRDRLPRAQLGERLARARGLILSSEIEGFGLPALESYAALTPVMYVTGTAVHEILGQATRGGFYLSSLESFEMALQEILEMGENDIRTKSTQLKERFSWEKCTDATLSAYNFLGVA